MWYEPGGVRVVVGWALDVERVCTMISGRISIILRILRDFNEGIF